MAQDSEGDYGASHLHKGEDYDADLSRGDMNTYMTYRLVINNHRNPNSWHERLMRLNGDVPETDLSHGIELWVAMHRLCYDTMSRTILRLLEPLWRSPFVGSLCPDAVVIARVV